MSRIVPVLVLVLLGCLGRSPVGAVGLEGYKTIAKAECSAAGVRITYDDKTSVEIPTGAKTRDACQEIKVSADGKVAAWVVACTGTAINGNGEGEESDGAIYQAVCARLTGLAAGKMFDIDESAAFIGQLAFKGSTHDLQYRSAPMHGLGAVFLYDMDTKKQLPICEERDASPQCTVPTRR